MQIKAADGRQPDILALEHLLGRTDVPGATRKRIEAEIRQIQAGERAERDAAYQIELYFGNWQNWATIHDLRIEVGGLTAQVDHVVINRLADVWVCESKSFAEGVSVNEYGEWSRWHHGRPEGMPSPIEQNRRHIHLLERVFEEGLAPLPRRLGLAAMKPRFHSLVLVSDNAQIKRPRKKIDGLDQVIKAEQLRTRLFEAFDATPPRDLSRVIGKEGLGQFARGLAALHRPATFDWVARFGLTPSLPREEAAHLDSAEPPDAATPARPPRPWLVKYDGPCSSCGALLRKGSEAIWDNRQRKMFCLACPERASQH